MHLNESTAIITSKIVLVPYRKEHVQKYNQWMQSAELRELTASEPLTLAQEYEMQESWKEDDDKLTFIILARTPAIRDLNPNEITKRDIDGLQMIGDVNMFFKPHPDVESEIEGEVEVMIAEPEYRHRGVAFCALSALLHYVASHDLNVVEAQHIISVHKRLVTPKMLVARIAHSNTPSIRLFQRLGFTVTKEANIFGEIEMRFMIEDAEVDTIWGEAGTEIHYPCS